MRLSFWLFCSCRPELTGNPYLVQLSAESRSDTTLKTTLNLGKRSTGDSITLTGHNYTLTLTLIHSPPPPCSPSTGPNLAALLLPLTRLLFLQEYATRRQAHAAAQPTSPHAGSAWARPILASLGVVLAYVQRAGRIRRLLEEVAGEVRKAGSAVEVGFFGGKVESAILRVLEGAKELGGRAVLRVGSAYVQARSVPATYPHSR